MKKALEIPNHIAIIMDGNGRWAKKRLLPRKFGHKAGMNALHRVVEACSDYGVNYLTVYAFSTENWKRSDEEVNFLMDLAVEYFIKELDELNENNVKVKMIGDRRKLPKKVQDAALKMEETTKDNTGLNLNVALNYGGRDELVNSVREIIEEGYKPEDITEDLINQHLYTKNIPDPDILVRTGGEKRISNFLLWQNSYSEFIFTDDWWPDCDKDFIKKIIEEYNTRERRYGSVNEN